MLERLHVSGTARANWPVLEFDGRIVWMQGVQVEAEPGIDEEALAALEREGWPVQRFRERSLYFGGVQAVARDPETGELSGGGDPRRGGSAVLVE